jgi:hypothetical protein
MMAGIGHNMARRDPPLFDALDVFAALRLACREAGGQKAWAEAHGVTPQHLNDVLAGRREVTPRILAALGFRQVVRYARTSISQQAAA